jgi:hypothetical protein
MKSKLKQWGGALICSAIVCGTHAQSKFGAYALAQAGLTVPAQAPSFFGEVAGGVRYGRFGLGLATGADEAPVKSIPILVDARFRILTGKHALEVFSQQGVNKPTESHPTFQNYQNGAYWYGGLTFRLIDTKGAGGCWLGVGCRYRTFRETGYKELIPLPLGAGPLESGSWIRTDWAGMLTIGWRL